jgi:uncharacterized membrane protein YesL
MPGLRSALRLAAVDLYYHLLPLAGLNIIWGCVVVLAALTLPWWPLGGALLAVVAALPTVGLFRVAALVARGEGESFQDGVSAWRRYLRPALAAGAGTVLVSLVLFVDLAAGIGEAGMLGVALATMALWAWVVTLLVMLSFWPILVDPQREGHGARAAFRLAGLLVLAYPLRVAALGVVVAVVLLVSTLLAAALLTVALAYVALLTCHHVLPAADRLERHLEARTRAAAARTAGD